MVKKILFKISPDGEVQLEVQGAQGSECEAFTAPFEAMLGPIAKRELKDTYFQSEVQTDVETGTSEGGLA